MYLCCGLFAPHGPQSPCCVFLAFLSGGIGCLAGGRSCSSVPWCWVPRCTSRGGGTSNSSVSRCGACSSPCFACVEVYCFACFEVKANCDFETKCALPPASQY